MQLDRRRFLHLSALTALQLAVLGCRSAPVPRPSAPPGRFGPLVSRPDALLDLPAGFTCVRIQRAGTDRLDDGRPVPGCLDGMACYAAADGTWVLLRNHEIGDDAWVDEYKYTGQAKIVTWGKDRNEAIDRMQRALRETIVDGVATITPLHQLIMADPGFRKGEVHTGFVADFMDRHADLLQPEALDTGE